MGREMSLLSIHPPQIRRFWGSHHDPVEPAVKYVAEQYLIPYNTGTNCVGVNPTKIFGIWVGLQLFNREFQQPESWDSRWFFFAKIFLYLFFGQFRESDFSICTICTIFFVNSILGILCMSLFCLEHANSEMFYFQRWLLVALIHGCPSHQSTPGKPVIWGDPWVRWPWAKDAEQKREASSGQWRLVDGFPGRSGGSGPSLKSLGRIPVSNIIWGVMFQE